jgi:hypothetical protein
MPLSDFKDMVTSDGKVLFCQACGKSSLAQQPYQVTQHLIGGNHNAAVFA